MKRFDKKIAYINFVYLPSKSANSIHLMEMVYALNKYSSCHLVVPKNYFKHKKIETFYGIKDIKLFELSFVDFFYFLRRYPFLPLSFLFNLSSFIFSFYSLLFVIINKYDLVYTRHLHTAFLLSFFKPVIYETHMIHKNSFYRLLERKVLKNSKMIVYINEFLRKSYHVLYPEVFWNVTSSKNKEMVLYDAVNLNKIKNIRSLALSHRPVVGYVGSLSTLGYSKGVEYILFAAHEMKNVHFYIVGLKNKKEINTLKKYLKEMNLANVHLIPRVSHKMALRFIKSFDIVVLPLPNSFYNRYFTSPLKLFEYMAMKKCIVSSDLPSIKLTLGNKEAIFFKPNNLNDFISKLRYALYNYFICKEKAKKAYNKVKKYIWDKRAKKLLFSFFGD